MRKLYARLMKLVNLVGYPIKLQILKNSHRVRVLIIAESSVVLVRSSIGTQLWSLPGGGIKKGESPQHAAAREVFEETGLKIDQKKFSVFAQEAMPLQKSNYNFDVTFLIAELKTALPVNVIHPLEILETAWFPLNNLPPNHSKTLDAALKMSKSK